MELFNYSRKFSILFHSDMIDKHSKSNSTKRKTDALMKNINRLSLKDSKPNIEKLVHSRSNVSTSESPIINQIDSDQPKTGSEEISEKDVDDFQEIFNKFNELKGLILNHSIFLV